MFSWILNSILLILTLLCFWLPYKSGRKATGITVGILLTGTLAFNLVFPADFLTLIINATIIAFSIVFLSYWLFRAYKLKKVGLVVSTGLFLLFSYFGLQPWVNDRIFSEDDAASVLRYHDFKPNYDFELLSNESGGLTEYYHIFEIQLSVHDFEQFRQKITSSSNFQFVDNQSSEPQLTYLGGDTINLETPSNFKREYYSSEKDGVFHHHFILSKTDRKLKYIGSNE